MTLCIAELKALHWRCNDFTKKVFARLVAFYPRCNSVTRTGCVQFYKSLRTTHLL